MNQDQVSGTVREGVGRLQDAASSLLGSSDVRGKVNEAAGSAQAAYGQVRDQADDILELVQDFVKDQPFAAAAIGAGVGLLFGMLMRGGRKVVYVRR